MRVRMIAGLAALVLALTLTACKEGGNEAFNRRRAELFGKSTPTAQTTATPAPVATTRPTALPAEQTAGDVQTAVGIDPEADTTTQFLIAAALIILGIPTVWTIALKKVGAK